MTRVLPILTLILIAAYAVSAISSEFAGLPTSQPQNLRWRSSVVRIAVSTSLSNQSPSIKADSDVLGALKRSAAAWEAVTGLGFMIETTDRVNVSPAGPAGDGISLLTIAQTPENLQMFANDPFGESAKTRIFYNRRGSITEGDIVLNPLQQFSTDGTFGTFDLETTFSHEIGHLLGLRHSAISGSLMAERIPRNGDVYLGPRTPTEADVTAVRDLYAIENDACCGTISGKISFAGKAQKGTTVWAEDRQGRLVALGEANADGTYRLGGLANAKYELFWQRDDSAGTATGSLGAVAIDNVSPATLSKRLSAQFTDLSLEDIGLNLQPGDAALFLRPGRQYSVSLAGRGLAEGLTAVTFSAKSVHSDIATLTHQVLNQKLDGITLIITVDADAEPGVYTLYAERRDGARTAFVGAIVISK